MRPLRFGVTLFPRNVDREAWRSQVGRMEALGYTALTVTDHFGSTGGIFAALTAAHYAAPSMRLGTLVLNSAIWNPAVLAREVITCDALTGGKFELGIGAGWNTVDYQASGVPIDSPPDRIARLEEMLDVLAVAFTGEPFIHKGRNFDIDSPAGPRPAQEHVPVLIGGGSRRILELAGRRADIVSLHRNLRAGVEQSWRSDAEEQDPVARRVSWVRAAAGERFDKLELHALIQTVVVTDDRREAAARIAAGMDLTADFILQSPHYLIGTRGEIAADLLDRAQRWGITYWTAVGAATAEALAPILVEVGAAR